MTTPTTVRLLQLRWSSEATGPWTYKPEEFHVTTRAPRAWSPALNVAGMGGNPVYEQNRIIEIAIDGPTPLCGCEASSVPHAHYTCGHCGKPAVESAFENCSSCMEAGATRFAKPLRAAQAVEDRVLPLDIDAQNRADFAEWAAMSGQLANWQHQREMLSMPTIFLRREDRDIARDRLATAEEIQAWRDNADIQILRIKERMAAIEARRLKEQAAEKPTVVTEEVARIIEVCDKLAPLGAELTLKGSEWLEVSKALHEGGRLPDETWRTIPPHELELFCPACGKQHLDIGEFATRVHRKHLCENTPEGPGTGCGHLWVPFPYATRGVQRSLATIDVGMLRDRFDVEGWDPPDAQKVMVTRGEAEELFALLGSYARRVQAAPVLAKLITLLRQVKETEARDREADCVKCGAPCRKHMPLCERHAHDLFEELLESDCEPLLSALFLERLVLRPAVRWFAEAMEQKLRENDHKGTWEDCDLGYLLTRLTEERRELTRAIGSPADGAEILKEAADIANFAMMIADQSQPVARAESWYAPLSIDEERQA